MKVLETIIPVFFMIGLGILCREKNILTSNQVEGMNAVVGKVFFPFMVFNALFTTSLQLDMVAVIMYMFIAHLLAMLVGKCIGKFTSKEYSNVSSYLMATVDGGNVCYPLYATIVGGEYIGNVVLLDIACLFIVFIVIPVLVSKNTNENTSIKELCLKLFKDPLIITILIALVTQLLGVYHLLETTGWIGVYESIISMVTGPIVACILFVIGYRFTIEKESIKPLLKTIVSRVVVMGIFAIGFTFLFSSLMSNEAFKVVVPLYFLSPPALVLVNQLEPICKRKEDKSFISAFISLYMIVTLIVYVIVVILL